MSELQSLRFIPMPLGTVRPRGWLKRQLRIQADGLTGHLDEFWPDVADSMWFGGGKDGWERAPYWLDGALPLAHLLGDAALIEKVTQRVESVIERQGDDGWLGPRDQNADNPEHTEQYDLWALVLAMKVLVMHHEATGSESALRTVERCLKMLHERLPLTPIFNWAAYRWFEALIPIYYVYERTGEAWLLELAGMFKAQGFDYAADFARQDVTVPTPRRGLWKWNKHVVNLAMAIKGGGLWSRLSGDGRDREFPHRMTALLDAHHGQATGVFTGDECVAGKSPVQGTELCAVAEYMFSLEQLLAALGDPVFGDRLERIAFNAWPATFKPDMWAHQYDQQANQMRVAVNPDHMWTTNNAESNLYGLEPNFGCCTANMHQGWPKFAMHLWMRTPEGGVAAVAYAPSETRFEKDGVNVRVALDTEYPFRETLRFTVAVDGEARFPLVLRIPGWARDARLRVAGEKFSPEAGTFHAVERVWKGETDVELVLPMTAATSRRYNDAICVERGPLVYSLKIEEEWKRVNEDAPQREEPHADWEVHPKSAWNVALRIDERDPGASLRFEERPMGDFPFSPEGAAMRATVMGRELPFWGERHGWAAETPVGPVESDEPEREFTLLPYGCTNLRITEFPLLKR